MFDILKNFFNSNKDTNADLIDDLELLCGLMIEAANIDGFVDQKEVNKISKALINTFDESSEDVSKIIEKCLNELNDHKSLHFFTSKINKSFTNEKKIKLIEILWEIVLEDGKVHDFESNLLRRLSGLLYISDMQCGNAKKKVLAKLQIID